MPRHELGHRHLLVKKTILNVINGHKNEDGGERPEMPNQVSISSTFYAHFFLPIVWRKKFTCQNVTREELLNLLLYEKCAHKMLMKLTPVVNFVNFLSATF